MPYYPRLGFRNAKGNIINISSVSGLVGHITAVTFVHYVASNSGMVGLRRSLAVRLGPNISVNAIASGVVETELAAFFSPEKKHQQLLLETPPLKRPGRPEDVAYAAVFLASSESDWITGEVLAASGGRAMR